LFGIDPRGLIPNPEEERDLVQLNRPLLDAVPEGDDLNIIDPDPIMPDLPLFDALNNLIGKKKREVEDVVDDPSSSRRRRQAETGNYFDNSKYRDHLILANWPMLLCLCPEPESFAKVFLKHLTMVHTHTVQLKLCI
jgi:hypothetical protein